MISSVSVKQTAASCGFDACGITSAEPMPEAEEKLRRWLGSGCHGTMKYLEDFEVRAKKFWESFPEAKSIIVIGVNYYSKRESVVGAGLRACPETEQLSNVGQPRGVAPTLTPHNEGKRPKGRVARYAWGKDYHRVIGKRMEEFRDRLVELTGYPVRTEICVDTKPLLERSLAQKAGLGFVGKQSQLLNLEFGPWLFLAELVTDLDLEPDIPFVGNCGTCRICINQCPTQAIQPEGGIDARRCIAYLTIEHKGRIPQELQPSIGDWVFGCDICLQVCPYTSKSKVTRWSELKAEAGFGAELDLTEFLHVTSNRSYKQKFEGTAITRANRKQFFRNAEVVLENRRRGE